MPGKPERTDHPIFAYLIGLGVIMMILVVLAGVLFHFTLSPHAPEIITPVKAKLLPVEEHSAILEEARKHEEFEIHRHFHNIVEFPKLPENNRPVCFICHSDYPHSKNKKVRSLLNMHTQYFACETCHIKEDKDTKVVYQWYNPYDDNPKGPFFGTSYDEETGNLVEVEDKFSKIAPYFKKAEILSSAIQMQDAPLAKDYMRVRDTLTPEQRDGVKMKFHVNIKPKGHECNICHSQKGIFDYNKLGFSKKRTADLEQLNVKGLITKYENFYLPNLFK
ncbi:MAG: hypothetical protein OET81_05870 [Desulfobacteraceae bacterium]|nr:hypothetical protein [Desulfobacteraceae bacterium]